MRTHTCVLLAALYFSVGAGPALAFDAPITDRSVLHLADEREAAVELGREDAFVLATSPFDRAARKQTDQAVSRAEFLRFISTQALDWTPGETARVARAVGSVRGKLAPWRLPLPSRILLVKTTGREEGNAAYCRNTNVIVLPREKVADAAPGLEDLLIHELFHIISRNDRRLRDALYESVGFKPCAAIELPGALALRRITNPDAPKNEHYIEVLSAGQPVKVVPVLFSNQPSYDANSGKDFFAYLTFKLMAIERVEGEWRPRMVEAKPWLLEVSEVGNFHEQIGRNSNYIIHPEELLADNFVHLVNQKRDLPTPRIIEKMRQILAETRSQQSD